MSFGNMIKIFAQKHAPELLTAAACVGVGVTSALACKATLEAREIMDGMAIYDKPFKEKDKEEKKDIVEHFTRFIFPEYIPAILSGAATIACMVGANKLNANRVAAMASICAASTNALESYKETVAQTVGDKKAGEIAQEVVQKAVNENPVSQSTPVTVEEGTESLWYDENSGRYFYATMEYMRRAETDLKEQLLDDDIVRLNDIYDRIGLDRVKLGDDLGFDIKRGDRVVFDYDTALSDDDKPMCTIAFPVKPLWSFYKIS